VARPHKPTPEKFCAFCKKKMERNSLKNGGLEALFFFRRRKFCDRSCVAKARSARTAGARAARGPKEPSHRARDMTPAQREARKRRRNTPAGRAHRATYARERYEKKPEQINALHLEWRKRNPERVTATRKNGLLKFHYGITTKERDEMIVAQGGGCAICGSEMKPPHVDHCHEAGKGIGAVRGILCGRCNSGLGQFKDSIETLLLAVLYLAKRGRRNG
jgi:hypothetical protein